MRNTGMSKIVKTITRIAYVFIITFGIYVIVHGHLTPGGGFQGGAVIASSFALLLIAYGKEIKFLLQNENNFSLLESLGALAFICLALIGLGTTFFHNFLANSGILFGNSVAYGVNSGDLNTSGVLPLMNISVGLKVLAGIGSILIVMMISVFEDLGGESKRRR